MSRVFGWCRDNVALLSIAGMLVILSLTLVKVVSLAREGQQAHDGLCARKHNIVGRVTDTWEFLDSGKTIPGVSDVLILRGISRDIEEFDSLTAVKCDPPIPSPRRPKEKP